MRRPVDRLAALLLASAALAALAAPLAGCGDARATGDDPAPVHVLAAASFTNVLEALRPELEAAAGGRVVLSFAASSVLARQVRSGAACDLYLSADSAWVDDLAADGLVAERRALPPNAMVVIVPRDRTPGDGVDVLAHLRSDRVRRIAIADPDAVPAGRYARRALQRAGVWTDLAPRPVSAANVRQALAWVESGVVDAGIVYASDALISSRIVVLGRLPVDPDDPVRGEAALTSAGTTHPAARRVWDALADPSTRAVFTRFGFGP